MTVHILHLSDDLAPSETSTEPSERLPLPREWSQTFR